jgi:hypothetical protein
MAEESASNGKESNGAARALSIPVIVLLLALLLIYFGPSTGYPGSGFSLGFPNPDVLGGEYRIS